MNGFPKNTFKADLRAGRTLIGLWQGLANPYTAEICATAGFDWLLFDGEHAPNDVPSLLAQLQAVSAYPAHPIARLPAGETRLIKQYLDIGFTSLLIPFVETVEQAKDLVSATRYPPKGVRGVASAIVRASRWNAVPHYLDRADDEICLLVQIELPNALVDAARIAAVDGVDGVFIGPSDLSAALGHRGEPNHPDVQKRIAQALSEITRVGKPAGILAADPSVARRYIDQGFRFVAVGTDVGLLATATRRLVAEMTAAPAAGPAPISAAY